MSVVWVVCPICGSVVADVWAHTTWHETALAELVADVVESYLDDTEPVSDDGVYDDFYSGL